MSSTAPLLKDPAGLRPVLEPYRGPTDDLRPREGGWVASVALVLREASPSAELLLIKRAHHDGDPWSGHMALPGGRRDPGDPSLLDTACRETHEEVAIPLAEEGELLGRLSTVAPSSPRLPPVVIVPFVFGVSGSVEASAHSTAEVEEVHWVALSHLTAPGTRTSFRYPDRGADLVFPAFDVGGRSVWGLTHRILEDLLARMAR